jgi:DNA-3-methyladenine glycosylase II
MKHTLTVDVLTMDALGDLEPAFKPLLERCSPIEVQLQRDYFASIASAIVGQQLSNRVAEVLWERLLLLSAGNISPEIILSLGDEDLRNIGISYSKIKYLKALAMAVNEKSLQLERLHLYDDDEIIRQLTQVKGIGPWTAEMFLIFSMGRTDVFSVGDGGLQRGVKWLYGMEQIPGKEELLRISNQWKPYRTIAALYLWKAIDEKLI